MYLPKLTSISFKKVLMDRESTNCIPETENDAISYLIGRRADGNYWRATWFAAAVRGCWQFA